MTAGPEVARRSRRRRGVLAALIVTAAWSTAWSTAWPTVWAAPAAAQEPFRIGLVALPGEEANVEGLARIKAAYSGALGLPVDVMVARDYATLAQAQIDGRLDYAVYSAVAYSAAMLRCRCLAPLAAPVDASGAVGLRSVLIVHADGPGAQGRLAVGPADSLATRLAPLAASDAAQTAAAEGRLVEADSASQAQAMFVRGEVDGFFGWTPALPEGVDGDEDFVAGVFPQLSAAGLDATAWRVVWRSAVLRYGPHAVRSYLPMAQRERLSRLLTGAFGDDFDPGLRLSRGHGGRFNAVTAADYAPVEAAIAAAASR